jgi:outer membrane receptor protein involved in Fe transport
MIGDANRQPTQGSYDVSEFFVEFNVPLLANVTSTDYLGVNAAYRYSDYSTVGGVDTWRWGIEWSPSFIQGLRFRGGQQRAIRAPNIIELFAPEMGAGLTIYQDPCDAESGLLSTAEQQQFCNDWGAPTGFVQLNGTVSALQNSNPNLKPEEADTWTAGFVYQPGALADHNFAITLDYYNIEIEDAVAPFGGGVDNHITSCFFSLDLNSEFCTPLVRDFLGEFEPINSQLTNVSLKKVSGIDLQVDFAFDLGPGRMDLFFLGTYQEDNGFQATALLPFLECAGKFGVPCGGEIDGTGSPRLRTNTRFAWSTGPWRVGLNWRWLEGMEDARTVRAVAFGIDPQPIIDTIPAEARFTSDYNYVDIFGSWEWSEIGTVRLGFDNVFDKEPPLMGDAQIQANTEPGTYDVFGRRVWLNFNMSF